METDRKPTNVIKYGLLGLLVIGWTLNPFMKRRAIGKLTSMDYFIVNFLLTSLFAGFFWVYLIQSGRCQLNVFSKMTTHEMVWAVGASIITVLTGVALIYLVKEYEVGHILPQIQPGVIVLTILSGYFLFGESLGLYKCLGVACIVVGMILINSGKSKQVSVGKRPWK